MAYKYIDHTADLGIEVTARTKKELLENIGAAIFDTQIAGEIETNRQVAINLRSASLPDLIIDWCRELLYYFAVKGFIPKVYDIAIKGRALTAVLKGETLNVNKHKVKLEIKNVTYHNFKLRKLRKGYKTAIIFDV